MHGYKRYIGASLHDGRGLRSVVCCHMVLDNCLTTYRLTGIDLGVILYM